MTVKQEIDRMVREQRAAKALLDAGDANPLTRMWLEDALAEECCLRLEQELERE